MSGSDPFSAPDSTRPAWSLSAGQTFAGGRYLLKRLLGQGGMSVVWGAYDTRLREPVALKFLAPQIQADPASLEALRRETLRSRKLSHPNIVRIYDLHEAPGEPPFVSMEYVDGPNFHYLRANRPAQVLPWNYLAPFVTQLCQALDYAHTERVIHRDLKPGNLMLDSSERLKLADFGLARVLHDSAGRLDDRAETTGTVYYMSPQQLAGQKPTPTDDIYSLGASLYELLTSTPPFYTGEILYQVQHNRPQRLDERLLEVGLVNDIPPEISALVMACLLKDPAQRPQSAKMILDWLHGVEASSPQVPETPSPPAAPAAAETPPALAPPPPPEPTADGTSSTAPELEAPSAEPTESKPRFRTPAGLAALLLVGCVLGIGGWYVASKLWTTTRGAFPGFTAGAAVPPATGSYESLFNGRDLAGWDGDPKYWAVENGLIVARARSSVRLPPRVSFLTWRGDDVADFELRMQFKGDANSGICYRAHKTGIYILNGYQVEISKDDAGQFRCVEPVKDRGLARPGERIIARATPDGEYIQKQGATADPARLQQAYYLNGWNECVIVAHSNHFRHWINGVLFSEVSDQNPAKRISSGRLGLEFSPREGGSIQFRDIRLKRLGPSGPPARASEDGWIVLFDGASTDAWRGYNRAEFPGSSWSVTDGLLKTIPQGPKIDLITRQRFENFELELEWRLEPGANSGIFYRVAEGYREPWRAAPEMQLLDDDVLPEGKKPKTQTGAIYGIVGPAQRAPKVAGEFNHSRIILQGAHVEHWLNGVKILEAELDSDSVRRALAQSRLFSSAQWGQETNGHIGLQHYGFEVAFRNIRIRKLPAPNSGG